LKPKCDEVLSRSAFKLCFQNQVAPLHLGVHGAAGHHHGKAVQVDPMKPVLKPPGIKRLKLEYDKLVSDFAFNFNLRRYIMDALDDAIQSVKVGRCRLTL
jgi:hypothetical protein